MHVATYYGNVTLVLILLQHGGSPDITNVVSFLLWNLKTLKRWFCLSCISNLPKSSSLLRYFCEA